MEWEKLLQELLLTPGVSGFEEPVRERIKTLIANYLDGMEVDSLGNLIGTKEGKGKGLIAFFAHMDELGLVVANITAKGFIHFKKIGGIDDRVLPSRHVRLLPRNGREIPGVIAWVPPHLMVDDQRKQDRAIPWPELIIDVGAANLAEVQGLGIRIGDPIVFTKQISPLANGRMAGRGMDNRAGCAVLIALIQELKRLKVQPQIKFAFTTQEEYGLRGATAAGYGIHPEAAFILDTASAPDFPGVPRVYQDQYEIGGGPVLRLVDARMITGRPLRNFVEEVAAEKNIPFQLAVTGGSTDAAAVQLTRSGVPVLPICLPCRYTHATVEVISLQDLETTVRLLREILLKYPDFHRLSRPPEEVPDIGP